MATLYGELVERKEASHRKNCDTKKSAMSSMRDSSDRKRRVRRTNKISKHDEQLQKMQYYLKRKQDPKR